MKNKQKLFLTAFVSAVVLSTTSIYAKTEKYSFDVIKDYNMKYTYGVLIKINRISFSFSGYQSFIPMPAFNSYNGTISIGI